MNALARLLARFRRPNDNDDDLAARHEAERIRDQVETTRLSQTLGAGSAGQNYESGRGPSG